MNNDLKLIKDKYGEAMMHLCRKLFPTILETDGLLFKLLQNNFAYSKRLCEDLVNNNLIMKFKDYIYSQVDTVIYDDSYDSLRSVEDLLKDKGYKFYECKTQEELESFKKYYIDGESLCSFKDPDRLDNNYVFFIVRDDAEKLNRNDFNMPKREDDYSTSVLSIQFTKGTTNTLSIISRYNHRIINPDATYSNNLERIAKGLTKAFEKEYNLNIESHKGDFLIPNYVRANDGKFYYYNFTAGNSFFCPNNMIIKDGIVTRYDKEKYILIDYYLLDLQNNKIKSCLGCYNDSFVDSLNINKMEVYNNKKEKIKTIIINKEIIIKIDKDNRMVYYSNPLLTKVDENFLFNSGFLIIKELDLPSVCEIGDNFLEYNKTLEKLSLNSLKKIGNNFLCHNKHLHELSMPNVEIIGDDFLSYNKDLTEIDFPLVKQIGTRFLYSNRVINKVNLPSVIRISNSFLDVNESLKELDLPNVLEIKNNFLSYNNSIERINAPKLKSVGKSFLFDNREIETIDFPNLERTGMAFLANNGKIYSVNLDSLTYVDEDFLRHNKGLGSIKLPKLVELYNGFLHDNILIDLYVPNLCEDSRKLLDKMIEEKIIETEFKVKSKRLKYSC